MSIGEQKKVKIAMEFLGTPENLVFDDLFCYLDSRAAANLENLLFCLPNKNHYKCLMKISIVNCNFTSAPFFEYLSLKSKSTQISFKRKT